jgi:hypothetical protein
MLLLDTLLASDFTSLLESEQRVSHPRMLQAGMNKGCSQLLASSFAFTGAKRRILFSYHKLVTCHTIYSEQVDKRDSKQAGEFTLFFIRRQDEFKRC